MRTAACVCVYACVHACACVCGCTHTQAAVFPWLGSACSRSQVAPGSSLGSMLSGRTWYESLLVLTCQAKVWACVNRAGWVHVPTFAPITVAGDGKQADWLSVCHVLCPWTQE